MADVPLRDWLTIAAIIVGPLVAVQVQRFLESLRDRKQRRLNIFHTLMATRAARVSPAHVQALNMIDIEFYGRRVLGSQVQRAGERAVTNAWRVYSDHLSQQYALAELSRWSDDGSRYFAKVLFELSRALGYDFDEVQLMRNVYSPIAQGKLEQQEAAIREGVEKLVSGKTALAVVTYPPSVPHMPIQGNLSEVATEPAAPLGP